ncbi:glycosyltransferase [Cyanobacterium aponinum UTEX 3222]|uniref:glycosyltransferase n=1 Tax=Cyanobacterium aponinum TaxID=379064 RepID=UPI0030916384|nr:glycosyltransferase [Cyanobacterium aponinum UTEX 3222]
MKIIIFGLISGRGGIQTHTYWLTKTLLESNYRVLIITPRFVKSHGGAFVETELFNPNLKIISLNDESINKKQSILDKIVENIDLLRQIRLFSPDIFFGVGTGWYMTFISLFLPPQTKKIFHEVMSGKTYTKKDPRWGVKYFFTDVYAQASDVGKNFNETFNWQKEIPVLPAFPEPLEITAQLPQVESKIIPLGKAKAALFSRLAPHKQAFWLVQQWDFLKNYLDELHIHGSGSEESLIRNYIEEKGIGDKVKCFGRYPDGQAYVDLLSSYDLTLLPTIGAEGSPLVLLESMACGVPFVAYGVGGIPDYGYNNPDVIVVPPEPWLTTQAREYTTTSPQGEIKAFLAGVQVMAENLAKGEINQLRLQQFYFDHYSYNVLKRLWLLYLSNKTTND